MILAKAQGGFVVTDTCNTAKKAHGVIVKCLEKDKVNQMILLRHTHLEGYLDNAARPKDFNRIESTTECS